MNLRYGSGHAGCGRRAFCALALWLAAAWVASAATNSQSLEVAPKWGVFERAFKSPISYANPLEAVTLTVVFTSPLGETNRVYGFWDGGKIWRVRYSPDMPGKWKFLTICSDAANHGLNNVAGEFLCTSSAGGANFNRHGPVRVARDHRHLEYADHTPFFWLADTVWEGALLSTPEEWNYYAQVRARQKFTAAEWVAAPDADAKQLAAYTGREHIKLNLDFFKKMDAKVAAANHAGILNVIVPLSEFTPQGTNTVEALPEAQAILLLRYLAARWGANDVVWLLTCEGGKFARWKHIGRAVFGEVAHAPVILYPGEAYWALAEFRAETWVDAFGYQGGQDLADDSLQWMLAGPVSQDWQREPARPYLNLEPPFENEPGAGSLPRASAQAVRRAAFWSALNTPAAGVSYGGHGVWDWETDVDTNSLASGVPAMATWQKALFMPAAKQMGVMADIFNSIDFGRLRPAPELVADQPGLKSPGRHIAAACTLFRDLALVYVPEGGIVELNLKTLPSSLALHWIDPRNGGCSSPLITQGGRTVKLAAPDGRDWLLWINKAAGK